MSSEPQSEGTGAPRRDPVAVIADYLDQFAADEPVAYDRPDAWIDASATKIGYEISFTRHFYKPQPLRSLDEIRADIRAVEEEAEGLLSDIVGGAKR